MRPAALPLDSEIRPASTFYYGWVNLIVASLAMVGTLPGRTQGLGLITEPLLRDLHLDRVTFAQINLWATLIGSLFAIGIGRFIDRFGSRSVLTIIAILLGTVTVVMTGARGVLLLGVFIALTRGLGQSALSVVSLTIVGKWFVRRLTVAMAVYSVLLSVGFMLAFPLVGALVLRSGWRDAWSAIGYSLLFVLAPAAWLFVRRSPEACGLGHHPEMQRPQQATPSQTGGFTLRQAVSTSAFWVFALASSVYGLIASGIALFNESILAERGFDAATYHHTLVVTALTALAGNFLGGWLAEKWSISRLMGIAMALLAASLVSLPHVRTHTHVFLYALVMGLAGGFVIVIFFSFWSRAFGRTHLGKIQGSAQTLTVIASAIGPVMLALCVDITGSYASVFYSLAPVALMLGCLAWFVRVPNPNNQIEVTRPA